MTHWQIFHGLNLYELYETLDAENALGHAEMMDTCWRAASDLFVSLHTSQTTDDGAPNPDYLGPEAFKVTHA